MSMSVDFVKMLGYNSIDFYPTTKQMAFKEVDFEFSRSNYLLIVKL